MKILVSDFDKTFYTEEIIKNVSLVNKFIEEGNIFIIATGRPLYLLKPELDKYSIKYNYLICNDGAVIFDAHNNVITKTNLEHIQTIEIFNFLNRTNVFERVYVDAICDFGDLSSKDYNGIIALPYDKNEAYGILKQLNEKYFTINAYFSHRWLNILSADVNKGLGIRFLKDKESWKDDDIYIVGDGANDISMTIFENSYAVANSNEKFKNVCNKVIEKFSNIFDEIKK